MFLVGRRRCFIIGTLSSFLLLLRHQHHFSNAFVPTKHQSSTWSYYWASHKRSRLKFAKREPIVTPESVTTSASTYFFASPLEQTSFEQQPETTIRYKKAQSRNLGSQELLMLPRQYALSSEKFAQMNHVMVATLNRTPSLTMLHKAIQTIQQAHPLLRARVQGTGEPEKRIDLFQMVRVGEPDPLRFVANDDQFHVDDILHVVQVASPDALEASWKRAFAKDLDCGDWCQIDAGPLWKLELHTTTIATEANAFSSNNVPCALVFSFNHAISDQSSANRILDQILEVLSTMESGGTSASPIRLMQHDLPVSMEESVLGRDQQWKKAGTSGLSIGTLQYVIGKAAETLKNPVILPEQTTLKHEAASSTNPLVGALSIISGQAAGGIDDATSTRKSTVQFRSLSKDVTSALLHACRAQGVSITHALTAAMTLTLSDFIDRGSFAKSQQQERNYKILESLDMRRFGAKLDNGETRCLHGWEHGPHV
ncbi:hypothetical protein MPSEU_000654400 [Mayamaea pseudoterrestris]|nr:hypothetical protein MPSEU_000654400 [Mayamaea pseudoterrestris]